ncbi:MAG: hypothetical protein DRH15_10585 [Deltaproteobacteria bacterium]|nr:MAG: hypothetical protein DRH15_10585 [Deltaproteobacteria bacterium]
MLELSGVAVWFTRTAAVGAVQDGLVCTAAIWCVFCFFGACGRDPDNFIFNEGPDILGQAEEEGGEHVDEFI